MSEVLVCGSAVTDLVFEVDAFPTRPEKYEARTARIVGGGCAGNAAVAVARLGGRAVLVARMGRDLLGDMTRADLAAEGVDVSGVIRTEAGQSAFSAIHVTPDGERMITAFRGAGLAREPDLAGLAPDAVLADTRWPEAAAAALALARAEGVPGVLDGEAPVAADLVAAASHVVFSAQGLRDYTGETDLARGLAAARSPGVWCAVTDGAAGAWVAGEPPVHHPAPAVRAVDTLGAGDVWHGAFALALAEGRDEGAAIRFAHAAAALKCTRPGGRRGAPSRAETDAFLEDTPA